MSSRYSERGYGRFDREEPSGSRYGRSGYDYGWGYGSQGREGRGFTERAADEVRSWVGDDEAERRRRMDERYENQGFGRDYERLNMGSYGRSYGMGYGSQRRSGDANILIRLSDLDFDIPHDEDIRGRRVYDQDGNEIGKVDDLLVDPSQRRVRFLQVISGGFLGLGGTMMLVPLEAITMVGDDRIEIDRFGRATSPTTMRYNPTLISQRSEWGSSRSGMMGPHRGRGPRGYRRSDDRIREDVSDRFSDDAYLDASGIDVTVNEGVVTLNGTVQDRSDRRRAEDLAMMVPGVQDVVVSLTLQPTGVSTTSATTTETSGRAAGAAAGRGTTRTT